MNPDYAAAIEAHNAAQRIYAPILAAFRAGTIDTAEYLVARTAMKAADAAFDVAFAKEAA